MNNSRKKMLDCFYPIFQTMVPIRKGYWIRQFRFGPVTNLFVIGKEWGKTLRLKPTYH